MTNMCGGCATDTKDNKEQELEGNCPDQPISGSRTTFLICSFYFKDVSLPGGEETKKQIFILKYSPEGEKRA